MSLVHETRPVLVWADIDVEVAEIVEFINTLDGARTFASCRGTIGEGGPAPYKAYVDAWIPPEHLAAVRERYEVFEDCGGHYWTVRPRESSAPQSRDADTHTGE